MKPDDNCTREEALTHYGFTYVGRKSINREKYSNCWYNEALNIFAVRFWWRSYCHKFMSRDKEMQSRISKTTSEMWYGSDVVKYFEILNEKNQ